MLESHISNVGTHALSMYMHTQHEIASNFFIYV